MTTRRVILCGLLCVVSSWVAAAAHQPADLVLMDARIYVSSSKPTAEALAVRAGRLVYVGDAAGAQAWVGPTTQVERAHGRLVLPGLIDAHAHPADTLDLDVCDLNSKAMTLRALSGFVQECLKRYHTAPGAQLLVYQWNFAVGNQPDADFPTLRAALDKASTTSEIQLMGDDGHHGGFNSLALSHARNLKGQVVGISKATLATDFKTYGALVGVNADGQPDGSVSEDARYTINARSMSYTDYDAVLAAPEKMCQRFNSTGITAVMDAMTLPEGQPIWDKLSAGGHMTMRTTLAQFYDPSHTRKADGQVDYDGMVEKAKVMRAKYAANPLVHADFIKMFADGVVEGNPFAVPPALGNAAMLKPFLQPVFATDARGHATVLRYVDTGSPTCAKVQAHPEQYRSGEAVATFVKENGFYPKQCQISSGQLQHEREIEMEYIKRMHLAGFNIHIHAIGDRAVHTAVDAIEAARATDGNTTTHDSLAHVQFAQPEDVARMGRDHLYLAYTYSWANVELDYDMTVVPFLQKMIGNSYEARHPPGSVLDSHTYPVRSSRDAGAILVAGSDAPVSNRDPIPFQNMALAVTRRLPGQAVLSPGERISIRDVLDAYTINGARFLGWDKEIGSLEVGKSADFVIMDRDILALADQGHPDDIYDAHARETWFKGARVYQAKQVN